MGRNVLVIGMHRSGTSAVTNALRLLGFSIGTTDDFFARGPANAEGNWEHLRLMWCNDLILNSLGGSWDAPPDLPDGWERRPEARAMIPQLNAEFDDVYGHATGAWLWKDPRNCLTLPFWLAAWNAAPVAVIVFRHPVAVARSLGARNGIAERDSLALWQRYNEEALRNTRKLAVLVRSYDRAFADPLRFVQDLRDELSSLGARADGSVSKAAAAIKPSLRRNLADERELASLSPRQLRLWQRLNDAADGSPEDEPSQLALPRRDTRRRWRPD